MKLSTAATLVGLAALLLLANEVRVGLDSRAGRALVLESAVYGRSGKTIAAVTYEVDGRPVAATLRAWYCRLNGGDEIPILFTTDDPKNVVPDWFWQRHFGSAIAATMFAVLAGAEAMRLVGRRRREAVGLLREDGDRSGLVEAARAGDAEGGPLSKPIAPR